MRHKRRIQGFFSFLLAGLLGVSVGVVRPVDAADKVEVTMLPGVQSFPLTILAEKIDEKYDLDVSLFKTPGPAGLFTRVKTGNYQVAMGSILASAIFRAQGHKVQQIYSLADMTATGPMVLKGSAIKGYGDFKGKKIGMFGGPTATATFMLRALCKKFYGFDPFKEAKAQFGAPPLLWGGLEKGELDVITTLEPFITRMLESKKFERLPALGEAWNEKTGERPLLVTVSGNMEWLEKNRDVAKRFVRAFKESIEYVQQHREVWPEIAKTMGVKTDWGLTSIYDRVAPSYVTRWDKEYIQQQIKWADTIKEIFGGKLKGVPESFPDDAFSFDYAP